MPQPFAPLIVSFSGTALTDRDRAVFKKLNPIGFILFKHNCDNVKQLKNLCRELASFSPLDKPLIFIDQEGGRVVRIDWESYIAPAGKAFGDAYNKDPELGLELARLNGYVLAGQLHKYGITVNCLPVADVAVEGAHDVIGDRAFSKDPEIVSKLCEATIEGMQEGGNWSIIKHAPGHGRALADSHLELPVVDVAENELLQTDFVPFKRNNKTPFIMTAHILYPQLDAENCATQSKKMIHDIIKGKLGMEGLVVSDALHMEALEGSVKERAEKSLAAGCDILLHCSGKVEELEALIGIQDISDEAWQKLQNLPELKVPCKQKLFNARMKLREYFALNK